MVIGIMLSIELQPALHMVTLVGSQLGAIPAPSKHVQSSTPGDCSRHVRRPAA